MISGQPEVVVLGAQSGVREVEDAFGLSEVRGGFEEQGIRAEATA